MSRNGLLFWIKFHITHENKRLLFSTSAINIRRESAKVAKMSACQSSRTRGEGFGKLQIKLLLTQGYAGEKMRFSMLGPAQYVLCISGPVD